MGCTTDLQRCQKCADASLNMEQKFLSLSALPARAASCLRHAKIPPTCLLQCPLCVAISYRLCCGMKGLVNRGYQTCKTHCIHSHFVTFPPSSGRGVRGKLHARHLGGQPSVRLRGFEPWASLPECYGVKGLNSIKSRIGGTERLCASSQLSPTGDDESRRKVKQG
eukprot:1161371-Pelagomonas_calceolata.AAC.3